LHLENNEIVMTLSCSYLSWVSTEVLPRGAQRQKTIELFFFLILALKTVPGYMPGTWKRILLHATASDSIVNMLSTCEGDSGARAHKLGFSAFDGHQFSAQSVHLNYAISDKASRRVVLQGLSLVVSF
jgi:hypothetical protein